MPGRVKVKDFSRGVKVIFQANKKSALREIGMAVQKTAKQNVRKKTRKTERSIRYQVKKDEVTIGTNHWIGRLLETGRRAGPGRRGKKRASRMKPYPWLQPAVDSNRSNIRRITKRNFGI